MQLLFNGVNNLKNNSLKGSYKQQITSNEEVVEFNIASSFTLLGLIIDSQDKISLTVYLDSSLTYNILEGTWKGEVILNAPIDIVNLDDPISSKFYIQKPAGIEHTITVLYRQPEHSTWVQVDSSYTTNGNELLILKENSNLTFNYPLVGNVHLYPLYNSTTYQKFVRVVIDDGVNKRPNLSSIVVQNCSYSASILLINNPLIYNYKVLNSNSELSKYQGAENLNVNSSKSYWEVIKELPNNSINNWSNSIEYEVSSDTPDDYLIHISLTELNIWGVVTKDARDVVPYYQGEVPDFYLTASSADLTGDLWVKVNLDNTVRTLKIYYGNSSYSNGGGDSSVLRLLLDEIEV